VRYDTGPMVGAAEVLCYGTAVIVEPIHRQSPGAQPSVAPEHQQPAPPPVAARWTESLGTL